MLKSRRGEDRKGGKERADKREGGECRK